MSNESASRAEREQVLDEVLTAYLKAVDAGQPPDRRVLLDRFLELAPDLERFFADQDAIGRWTEPLHRSDLDTPPDASGGRPALLLGSFGDYELLGVLGRGGMGVVYKARQQSLNRPVALKVIRAGEPVSLVDVRRFRTEAEVVAQLEHPNIVPVYEVGERDGFLYLSMRLVEGGTLADQIDRFATDPRAAAKLVATVARAVYFAHQRGVLHRDLKPGNILLDSHDRPLVTDFGLAKRVEEDSGLTQSGVIVGTPSYMAPEQAAAPKGTPTTTADVWGLGAVLYALLTGRPPFRGATVLETLEQVRTADPEPPHRANSRVDRDLETICLKSLQKDPAGRYPSAEALADDLERWLRGDPILAQPLPWAARVWRWSRRNPTVASLAFATVILATVLLLGLATATWLVWSEQGQTRMALSRADAKNRWARRAVNEMYTQVAERWLGDLPHMTEVQREFLAKALEFYEESAKEPGAEPEDRLERARALCRITILRDALSHAQSESNYRESVNILQGLVAEFPEVPEYRLELARSLNRLGRFLVNTDRFPNAEVVLDEARTQAEALYQSQPDCPEFRLELANALSHAAVLFTRSNRLGKAREAFEQSRDHARALADSSPTVTRYRELLAVTLFNLGNLQLHLKCLAEAERYFFQVRNLLEPLVRETPSRTYTRKLLAGAWESIAFVLLAAGKEDEAERAISQDVHLLRTLQADFPNHPPYWHALASAYGFQGGILARLGRFPEAEAAFTAALNFQQKMVEFDSDQEFSGVGRRREELAIFSSSLAWLWLRQPAAEAEVRKLLPLLQRARAMVPMGEKYRLTLVGLAHYRLGAWNEAVAVLRQADGGRSPGDLACRWTTDDPIIRQTAEDQEAAAPALNAFCLAMAYHHLGRAGESRDAYRLGLCLSGPEGALSPFQAAELRIIRVEAERILGPTARDTRAANGGKNRIGEVGRAGQIRPTRESQGK
jgi:serine/threonine-protein kinase